MNIKKISTAGRKWNGQRYGIWDRNKGKMTNTTYDLPQLIADYNDKEVLILTPVLKSYVEYHKLLEDAE